jgi:hypothetical protein
MPADNLYGTKSVKNKEAKKMQVPGFNPMQGDKGQFIGNFVDSETLRKMLYRQKDGKLGSLPQGH